MTGNQSPNPHEKPDVVVTLSTLAFPQLDGRWAQEDSLDVHGSAGLEYASYRKKTKEQNKPVSTKQKNRVLKDVP